MECTQYHWWKPNRHDQEPLHGLLFYRPLPKQEKEGIYPINRAHGLKQLGM